MSAVVIGVGNRLRRDDGAGLAVVERLRAADLDARLLGLEHVPPDLYEQWAGASRVILVDAASSGAAPGTLRRFDGADPVPGVSLRLSTHGFGLEQAVELARALDQLPASLTVYAIEGATFDSGEGLTPAVAAAADDLALLIRTELEGARA